MRVLLVNRPDAEERPGGDCVQMAQTGLALQALGVEVATVLGLDFEPAGFDLVHVFNLQTPDFTLAALRRARAAGVPTALSTIYWDFGADRLIASSRKWQGLERAVGRALARRIAQRAVVRAAAAGRLAMRDCLSAADLLLPNSQAEIAHLRALLPSLPRTEVVPNGIDAKRYDPIRRFPRPDLPDRYVLIAARIERDKNQAAFCREVCPRRTVVLAGWVAEEAEAEVCRRAGAILVGPQSGDDLLALYQHAAVHALPSFRETPGLSSLEAAALGCAVVTTSEGSAREYLGSDATYVEPWRPSGFVPAVESATAPPGLSERVRRDFDWSVAATKTLAAYRSVLG